MFSIDFSVIIERDWRLWSNIKSISPVSLLMNLIDDEITWHEITKGEYKFIDNEMKGDIFYTHHPLAYSIMN